MCARRPDPATATVFAYWPTIQLRIIPVIATMAIRAKIARTLSRSASYGGPVKMVALALIFSATIFDPIDAVASFHTLGRIAKKV